MSSPTERIGRGLYRALSRLRDFHPDMTVQQALCFMYIAGNPGTSQVAIMKDIGISDSLVSRAIALFTDVGVRNYAGLDLVIMRNHPEDRRQKVLELTAKGRRLMEDILKDVLAGDAAALT